MKSQKEEYVKQHIVPKFYLNHFASPGKTKGVYMIGVIQNDSVHFIRNTDDVGYIKNYYDDEFETDIKKWEHFYDNSIEKICSPIVDGILKETEESQYTYVSISLERKKSLSILIGSQLLRVPQFIEPLIDKAQNQILPLAKDAVITKYFSKLNDERINLIKNFSFKKEEYKHNILKSINSPNKVDLYCKILMRKPWVIFINPFYKTFPFITCDNPVLMINSINGSIQRHDNGIDNDNTFMYFPINSYMSIVLYPEWLKGIMDDVECKKLTQEENDIAFIRQMNDYLSLQRYNQCFIPIDYYNSLYS